MVQIKQIDKNSNIIDLYVAESEIASVWKKKVVDKRAEEVVTPIPWSERLMDLQFSKPLRKNGSSTIYKDGDDLYVFVEYSPEVSWAKSHAGWNKVEIIPEEYHYEYFVKLNSEKSIEGKVEKNWWNGGNDVELGVNKEIMRIDEETYNRLIKL